MIKNTRLNIQPAIAEPKPASRKRVVVILPRGEAIRNFVYSSALDLVEDHADVALLSVVPNNDFRQMLESRFPDFFLLSNSRDRWPVRFLREILDMAHGRWLWSQAAKHRWQLRDREATGAGQRIKRQAKKLIALPFANRPGLEMLYGLERSGSKWLRNDENHYQRLFTRIQPALVFNASHVHSQNALYAVQWAQWLGIPTATFIFSWDNLTSQGRILPYYDYYLVWNSSLRDQLLYQYKKISPEQIFVTGTPQFDFLFRKEFFWSREEFCSRIGADPDRPIVLYSTGMPNHMPGEPAIVESVRQAICGLKAVVPPQLVVRVYPKDLSGRFDLLKSRYPDVLFPEIPWESNWLSPKMEDCYLLTNMLRHADVGINIASTISLELCMLDKPVINIAYGSPSDGSCDFAKFYDFDHYRPVIQSGAVQLAGSPEDLQELLAEALARPEKNRAARGALMQTMFGDTLDGASAGRIARTLIHIAHGNE